MGLSNLASDIHSISDNIVSLSDMKVQGMYVQNFTDTQEDADIRIIIEVYSILNIASSRKR